MNLKGIFETAKVFAGQHGPEIYTGVGIGLSVAAAFLTGKGVCKAEELLTRIEYEEDREPTKKEKAIVYAKAYWPAVLAEVASIFFTVSGQHIQYKRTAAATAAYLVARDSLHDFSDRVKEELGEKKVKSLHDDIARKKIVAHPYDDETAIRTLHGDTLCYDAIAGRYFYSSAEAIRKAQNEMNKRLLRDNFISLNEFYDEIDLPHIKFGDELGWDVQLEGAVDIEFSSHLNQTNTPCLVIDSDICPRWHLYS